MAYVFSRKGVLDSTTVVLDRVQEQIEYFKSHLQSELITTQIHVFVIERRRIVSEYIKKGDLTKAFEISQKTYEFAPKDGIAISLFAVLYLLRNEYTEAVRILEPIKEEKEELKINFQYFENKNIQHRDFGRIKLEFGF